MACVLCTANMADVCCKETDAHLCAQCDQNVHSNVYSNHTRVDVGITLRSGVKPEEPVLEASSFRQVSNGINFESRPCLPDLLELPQWFESVVDAGRPASVDIFDLDPSWLDYMDLGFGELSSSGKLPSSALPEALELPQGTLTQGHESGSDCEDTTVPMDHAGLFPEPEALIGHSILESQHPCQNTAHWHGAERASDDKFSTLLTPSSVLRMGSRDDKARCGDHAVLAEPLDSPFQDNCHPKAFSFVPPSAQAAASAHVVQTGHRPVAARFREKKKKRSRQFKKKILCANRKSNAETRPRIKGRFARKEEVEALQMRAAGANT